MFRGLGLCVVEEVVTEVLLVVLGGYWYWRRGGRKGGIGMGWTVFVGLFRDGTFFVFPRGGVASEAPFPKRVRE